MTKKVLSLRGFCRRGNFVAEGLSICHIRQSAAGGFNDMRATPACTVGCRLMGRIRRISGRQSRHVTKTRDYKMGRRQEVTSADSLLLLNES